MQLREWIEKEGRSMTWLAIKLNVTNYRTTRICDGIGIGASEINDVAKLTDGKVNINDWVKLEKKRGKK